MCRYFHTGLYSILFLLPCISGCYVAGAIFTTHHPQNNIICNKSWEIAIDIVVNPPQILGTHTERCKDVTIHIRDSVDGNFIAVPMVLENVNLNRGELYWDADMKPILCDSGIEYVEYYIDYTFVEFGHYSKYYRTDFYRVPVSNK